MSRILINDGQCRYFVGKEAAYAFLAQSDIEIEPYRGTERLVLDDEQYQAFCRAVPESDPPSDEPECWIYSPELGERSFEVSR